MIEDKDKIIIDPDDLDYAEEQIAKETVRMLTFTLSGEHYCIDINRAKEVVKLSLVTKVPNTPAFIIGVTNLRGAIVPVIDIKHFLGLTLTEKTDESRIIVSDIKYGLTGILVDSIKEAIDVEKKAIEPPLATLKGRLLDFTKGQAQIGSEILIFLDLEKILDCEEVRLFKKGGTV